MPLTPGRLTSKFRQLGPSRGFLSRNFSAVSKLSDRKPADFSSPCIDARMLASSSTTNTVAVFEDAIASPIVDALPLNEAVFKGWCTLSAYLRDDRVSVAAACAPECCRGQDPRAARRSTEAPSGTDTAIDPALPKHALKRHSVCLYKLRFATTLLDLFRDVNRPILCVPKYETLCLSAHQCRLLPESPLTYELGIEEPRQTIEHGRVIRIPSQLAFAGESEIPPQLRRRFAIQGIHCIKFETRTRSRVLENSNQVFIIHLNARRTFWFCYLLLENALHRI